MGAAALFALACALVVTLMLPPSQNFRRSQVGASAIAMMARGAVSDRGLLLLYALGACSVGALVAVFNALGFRLTGAPFGLGLGIVSLLYLVYPLGTVSSSLSGRLADRLGRRAILPAGCAIALTGVLVTTVGWLPGIVLGVAGLTVGFFIVHGLASGWVVARAHAAGRSTSQSAAFYLFAYYVGSSTFGNLGSALWTHAGWTGVTVLAGSLLLGSSALAMMLRRIPSLDENSRPRGAERPTALLRAARNTDRHRLARMTSWWPA